MATKQTPKTATVVSGTSAPHVSDEDIRMLQKAFKDNQVPGPPIPVLVAPDSRVAKSWAKKYPGIIIKVAKASRPESFTQELADKICYYLSHGYSLRKICDHSVEELDNSDVPDITVIMRWLSNPQYTDFRKQYSHAREVQADYLADEGKDISDNVTESRDAVAKAKLQVETRMWYASKLRPKKYGDKLDLTSDGDKLEVPIYGGLSAKPRTPIEGEVVTPKQIEQ